MGKHRQARQKIAIKKFAAANDTDRLAGHTPDGDAIWFAGTCKYALTGYVNQMRLDFTWQWTSLYMIRGLCSINVRII